MKSIIYKITNLINDKVYIGQTSFSLEVRMSEHIKDSSKEYVNRPLYDAFNKYGISNFQIEEIERTSNPTGREIFYIEKYNSYIGSPNSNGYNATLGGEGRKTIFYSDKEVIDYYLKLKNIKETAKTLKISEDTVSKILKSNNIDTLLYKKTHKGQFQQHKIYTIFEEKEVFFSSVTEAAKWVKEKELSQGEVNSIRVGIGRAISGKRKTYLGLIWKRCG